MKKTKIITIACGSALTLPLISSLPLTSCSPQLMEARGIDGFDWDGVTGGGFTSDDYRIDEKLHTITYTNGSKLKGKNIIIPNYVSWLDKTYKVYLAENCFENNSLIEGTLELNVFSETIPTKCFYNVSKITSVIFNVFPRDVEDYAFAQCAGLHKMYIRLEGQLYDKCTIKMHKIGNFAFYQCPLDQSEWIFGPSLGWLGESAFAQCTSISSIDLRLCGALTELPANVFSGCQNLTQVFLPETAVKFNDRAFAGCKSLVWIHLPIDNMRLEFGSHVFENCSNFLDFSRQYAVISMGEACFKGASRLQSLPWSDITKINVVPKNAFEGAGFVKITFYPSCVTNIEDQAFYNCKQLHFIDFSNFAPNASCPQWTGKNVFGDDDIGKIGKIILPRGLTPEELKEWNTFFSRQGIDHWIQEIKK